MPVYEYKCKKCGKIFESFRWASEESTEEVCPKCGSKETERQLSVFSSGSGGGCSTRGFS
jgi:putative FmdB family regulatory protein